VQVRASPGPAVASMCTVEGLPSSVIAGHPFQFALQTLDECKNATTSTNSVTCEVDSPADGIVPLEVQELGNGVVYFFSFQCYVFFCSTHCTSATSIKVVGMSLYIDSICSERTSG
jgi:hypothetical protein